MIQIRPVEVREPIYRGTPWRPVELVFRNGMKPLNLSGYDIVAELRAGASAESALIAVLAVDRDDNEGVAQPHLTATQTTGLAAAAVAGFLHCTLSGFETGFEPVRAAFGEIEVRERAAA